MAQESDSMEDEPEIKQSGDLSVTTSKKTGGQTKQVKYRMQLSIVNGEPILKLQEDDKGAKAVTSAGPLNKMKREVVEQILIRFIGGCMFAICILLLQCVAIVLRICFCSVNPRLSKEALVDVLCKALRIPTSMKDIDINKVLPQPKRKEIARDMIAQDISSDVYHYHADKWTQDSPWCQTFFMLYVTESSLGKLSQVIKYILTALMTTWIKTPNDNNIGDWYQTLQKTFGKKTFFQELKSEFDGMASDLECDWYGFAATLIRVVKDCTLKRLKILLVEYAMKGKNDDSVKININETEDEYFVYAMGGAVLNSMIRMTYGNNHEEEIQKKKLKLIHTLLLQYNNQEDDKEKYKNIPNRLKYENKGGLRIMRSELVPLCVTMIDTIHGDINNMIIKHGTSVADIVKKIQTEENQKSFLKLLTCNEDDIQQDDDIDDVKQQEQHMAVDIFTRFTKGLVSKCVWARLKRIKPDSNSVALRKKLAVFHNSSHEPKLSLQPKSN